MSDILETMREYEEYSETKSEREAFAAVIDELIRLRAENAKLSARSVLIPESVQKIIDDYPAVCAERDRMRDAVLKADVFIRNGVELGFIRLPDTKLDPAYHTPRIVREAARAAIEGVKEPATHKGPDEHLNLRNAECLPSTVAIMEPASPWRDIESAPKDGTWIFIYKNNWPVAIEAKWDAIDDVDGLSMGWVFQDEFYYIGVATGCLGYNEDIKDGHMPTHWMPLPEPAR